MNNDVNATESESLETTSEPQKNEATGHAKARRIVSIVFDVILYVFLALCIFMLILTVVSKRKDGAVNLFGHEMRIVVSASMEKSEYSADVSAYAIKDIPVRSAVFIERAPDPEDEAAMKEWCSHLQEGDVLTFMYVLGSSQEVITHRIIGMTETASGYRIVLQGDNRASETTSVATQTLYTSLSDDPSNQFRFNYVIGKVTGVSVGLGNLVYAIRQPIGTALIIIVPCCIIIIWQAVRIISVVGEDRKKKAAKQVEDAKALALAESEERMKQAQELEELRKKYEELQRLQGQDGHDGDDGSVG